METKRLLTPGHKRPLRFLFRSWMLVLLTVVVQAAYAKQPIGTTNDRGQFKMVKNTASMTNGDQLYDFDLLIFNYDGNNYYWTGDVWLTLDNTNVVNLSQICRDNHCAYTIGDGNEKAARNWTETEGDFAGSGTGILNGFTTVTVGLYNPYYEQVNGEASKAIWVKVKVGIERNWYNHNYTLGVRGTWRTINGKEVSRHLTSTIYFDDSKAWPNDGVSTSQFTRTADHKVQFSSPFPSASMYNNSALVNWDSRVQLFNEKPSSSSPYVSVSNRSLHWNSEDWTATNGSTLTNTFNVESNFEPVTVYPRLERYTPSDYVNSDLHFQPKYDRDYNAIVVGGFPKAVISTINTNPWEKSVTLKWTETKPKTLIDGYTQGGWNVYRQTTDGTITKVNNSPLSYNTRTLTDKNVPERNVNYTYIVSFVPRNWSADNPVPDLYDTKENVMVKPLDTFVTMGDVYADDFDNKITVNWSLSEAIGTSTTLKFTLYHSTDMGSNKQWTQLTQIEAKQSLGTEYSYTHNLDGEKNCAPHFYKVTITAMDKEYTAESQSGVSSKAEGGVVSGSLTASKGMFTNVVKLRWEARQVGETPTTYNIYRRRLGTDAKFSMLDHVNGTNTTYTFDDKNADPGDFYEYQVESVTECEMTENGHTYTTSSYRYATDDGFCATTGVVSGTIAYGSNTAVQDVKVSLIRISDDNTLNNDQYHSASIDYVSGNRIVNRSSLLVPLTAEEGTDMFTEKPWTIQMFVRVDELTDNGAYLAYSANNLSLRAKKYDTGYHLCIGYPNSTTTITNTEVSQKTLEYGRFYSVAYSYDGNKTFTLNVMDVVNGQDDLFTFDKTASYKSHWKSDTKALVFGDAYNEDAPKSTSTTTTTYGWKGYLDDIRVFSGRKLYAKDILKNYNHVLAGNEKGLAIYLPLDEGIANQTTAYDMSKTAGISNGHHGKFVGMAKSSNVVPDKDQLALFNYTDEQGNFTVSGIPFNGEGISYMVTPQLGIHEFEPNYATRFISGNSLIHSGVNFKDISSFPVSGKVLYKNTTIPVEGATLYVDGLVATRNGKPIVTDVDGKFDMDVPIGDHYISVELNGHEFENEGRYPADDDALFTFDREVTDLTFYDVTTVTVAGRVAGGDVENNKPLGLGDGVANIGKATVTLGITTDYHLNYVVVKEDGVPPRYVAGTDTLRYEPATDNFKSEAFIAVGKDGSHQNYITIKTNPKTGEFAAKLPPLNYRVESVTLDNYPTANDMPAALKHIPVPKFEDLPMIDATKPLAVYTDSLLAADSTYAYFNYVAAAKIEYKAPSNLDVTENEDGTFGIDSIKVNATDKEKFALIDNNKNYVFGHPVYRQFDEYAYDLYAYERYYNFDEDASNPTWSDEPLGNIDVTIKCDYSTTTGIYFGEDRLVDPTHAVDPDKNTFQLDSLGRGVFRFRADIPNIVSPYTRYISIQYKANSESITLEHPVLKDGVIVLGSLPTGHNFVTEGPDDVIMILRDPPGSNSSATYTKGNKYIYQRSRVVTPHEDFEGITVNHFGIKTKLLTATDPVPSNLVCNEVDNKFDVTAGIQISGSFSNNENWTYTATTTKDISTSSDPKFDGADGDVFIGVSTNLIFGTCHVVHIVDSADVKVLKTDDAISMGDEFKTSFNYTQKHIVNELIPELRRLRNNLLQHVTLAEKNAATTTTTGKPIYLTTLSADDPHFGVSNSDSTVWGDSATKWLGKGHPVYDGPSYKAIFPQDYEGLDQVSYYNMQIDNWENILRRNEKDKVEVWENRDTWLKRNHSLDAGATVSYTYQVDTLNIRTNIETQEVNFITNLETGAVWNSFGMEIHLNNTIGLTVEEEQTEGYEKTQSFSYTLSETDQDYFTVDVYDCPDNYGPIFRTRAGATKCPYEDEVVTKYYEPGEHVLMEKTVQVESPEINCQTELINGIPAGGEAVFKVDIRNLSDTDDDAYFNLYVDDKSNPNGAAIYMDGYNITNGRRILVHANETMTKTFTMKQTNPDVLEYNDIRICLTSECQKDIADTTTVSVNFVAACSDIVLKANTTLVNSATTSPLILSMSGYNTNMKSLTGVLLQYKGANDADWTTLQEYVKDEKDAVDGKMLLKTLSGAQTLDFTLDLKALYYTDQVYEFRAITNCVQNGETVHSESDWVDVVRDITRPQLLVTPTPSSGVLGIGDDISILFNEDIRSSSLKSLDNFYVRGALNESEVAHDVALSLSGDKTVKTDATINLSGKSFAANLWLNYSADGTLLQHGVTGNNFTVAIEDGKLAVTVGGEKKVSNTVLPKNKWIFLALSYDNSGATPKLNASYAQDASTGDLMKNVQVPVYSGNGPVALGGDNLTAKVQELALWNNANSLTEALASRYTTKSQFTNGLLGYWQFNEGHGNVAADRARQRSMTLPSANGWYLDGVNYALTLDGSSVAAFDISTINTLASDDYLVEAWFRADESQTGTASVMSIGNDKLDLRLNTDGKLELSTVSGEEHISNVATVSNADLRDGQWHHVALNVLKSTSGNSTIYLDGKARVQVKASLTPALQGDKLFLGGHRTQADNTVTFGQFMKGAIDEVRIWKGRRTGDVIASTMYNRVLGDEPGLVAYFPLEKTTYDEYNQQTTNGFAGNFATASDAVSPMTVCKNYDANMEQEVTPVYSTASTPALSVAPKQENVMFNFVANERQITINLLEEPYKMEGCTIYMTASGVKDVNGNAAADITWSVYVQQNRLKWAEDEVSIVKHGTDETSFSVGIENISSMNETFEITDLPMWLSVNNISGKLSPLSKRTLNFTVDPSLAIGSYDATVYLKGTQSIPTPLSIALTVEGDRPDWVATTGKNTMTIIGTLKIDNELSTDPNDMVAAFRGTECVGVAQPEYYAEDDTYFVLLNVFGNEATDIVYKAYDASTGQVYPSITITGVDESLQTDRFEANKVIGTFTEPAIFMPGNEIEQDLSSDHAGWKWFSLYAQPKTNEVSEVFKDAGLAVNSILGKGDYQSTTQDENGDWSLFSGFNYASMYKLKVLEPYTEKIVGEPVNTANTTITLNSGWSWIGYPAQASNSLQAAFVNANPQDGDMVKGQSSFAMFYDGDWMGTLQAMTPGEGYMYQSMADNVKTFTYTTPAQSSRMVAPARAMANRQSSMVNGFKDNMTMIAVVKNGDELVKDAQVSVYAGTDLRALSTDNVSLRDDQALHFLTIGGIAGEADVLTFVISSEEGTFVASTTMTFLANAHHGTPAQPFVLQLADATGIDLAQSGAVIKSIQLFDGSGRMVRNTEHPARLYSKNDLKGMPAGVYYQQVTFTNGQTVVQKMMR